MGKLLTAAGIKSQKADPARRLEIRDTGAPGMVLRVTENGIKSYVWRGRIKGRKESIRITLATVGAITLEDARDMARDIAKQCRMGIDPRGALQAKADEDKNDFATVAEAFITEHVSTLRTATGIEAEIRRYLIAPWGKRPIASITTDDVAEVVKGILEDGKPMMARIVLSHAKRLLRWAGAPGRGKGRLKINPAIGLSARKDFDIKLKPRQVALSPEHIALIWRAAEKLPYPAGPYFKLLLLSGQRRGEVSGMKWSEIDLDRDKVWTIPAARMKAKRDHEVPLSPSMLAELMELRETRGDGDYVFSTDSGKRAIGNFSKLKNDLDAKINELAPDAELQAWTIHDLRRTMRTGLSAISMRTDQGETSAIPQDVRELVIAHVPSTLVQTYDRHDFRDEKRRALTLWADRLTQIINPPPVGDNVVRMRAVP